MAQGEKVPIVFFPKFTALSGAGIYRTSPVDLLGVESLGLTCWNGYFTGGASTPELAFYLIQSCDLSHWSQLAGPLTIAEGATGTFSGGAVEPVQRYVMMEVQLTAGSPDVNVTIWAIGYAQKTVR